MEINAGFHLTSPTSYRTDPNYSTVFIAVAANPLTSLQRSKIALRVGRIAA